MKPKLNLDIQSNQYEDIDENDTNGLQLRSA